MKCAYVNQSVNANVRAKGRIEMIYKGIVSVEFRATAKSKNVLVDYLKRNPPYLNVAIFGQGEVTSIKTGKVTGVKIK